VTAPITIRPAIKADATEVALLVNIATHGGVGMGWRNDARAEGTYDPAEVGRLDMLDESSDLNWRNAYMAESDGEIVGMVLGYPEPDVMPPMPPVPRAATFLRPIVELEWLAGGKWFLSMLAVHTTWRGKGIGGKLIALAEEKRAETGRSGLALIVEDKNTGARQLYERDGFSVAAARPMQQYPDGTQPGKDWLLMVKDI
jgi:ribosomal protein S18 acetylase RimI-like enzyme